jgi:hypothetical protein
LVILAKEEIQKYKKNYNKADQIYRLESTVPAVEEKLLLSKLMKQATSDRNESKDTIKELKIILKTKLK